MPPKQIFIHLFVLKASVVRFYLYRQIDTHTQATQTHTFAIFCYLLYARMCLLNLEFQSVIRPYINIK